MQSYFGDRKTFTLEEYFAGEIDDDDTPVSGGVALSVALLRGFGMTAGNSPRVSFSGRGVCYIVGCSDPNRVNANNE
jgi:hypothetical protein